LLWSHHQVLAKAFCPLPPHPLLTWTYCFLARPVPRPGSGEPFLPRHAVPVAARLLKQCAEQIAALVRRALLRPVAAVPTLGLVRPYEYLARANLLPHILSSALVRLEQLLSALEQPHVCCALCSRSDVTKRRPAPRPHYPTESSRTSPSGRRAAPPTCFYDRSAEPSLYSGRAGPPPEGKAGRSSKLWVSIEPLGKLRPQLVADPPCKRQGREFPVERAGQLPGAAARPAALGLNS